MYIYMYIIHVLQMFVCENTLYMCIGRSTQHIKADLTEKGDLGVVAEVWCHIRMS